MAAHRAAQSFSWLACEHCGWSECRRGSLGLGSRDSRTARTQAHAHSHMCTHMHLMHTYVCTHVFSDTCTHASHAHSHVHTNTCAHMHAGMPILFPVPLPKAAASFRGSCVPHAAPAVSCVCGDPAEPRFRSSLLSLPAASRAPPAPPLPDPSPTVLRGGTRLMLQGGCLTPPTKPPWPRPPPRMGWSLG